MTLKTATIPKGYKQTEIGVIPENWSVTQFRNVVSKVIDNRGKTPPYLNNSEYELIETSSISFVGQYPDYSKVTKFVTSDVFEGWFRDHPKSGDILISTVGEYSGASAIMCEDRGTVAQNLVGLRIKNLNPDFVFYSTRSDSFRKQLKQVMMSQAQPSLRVPWLLDFSLAFPESSIEQIVIATALSHADNLIEKIETLIEKKKKIKQGAMQELFTAKRRLPGFSSKWETKTMSEIGKPYGGISGKTEGDFGVGNCSYIPFMNIMSNPVIDKTYFGLVNILPGESQNKVQKGDLFFNISSETPEELGMCSVLLHEIKDLFLNSFCFGFRLNKEIKADGLFFSYYFRSSVGRKLIFSLAQGATRYNLSKSNFLKLEVPYPKPEEQTAIANVLLEMDKEIERLESELTKYRNIKQGMMQTLLTGKIRLIK